LGSLLAGQLSTAGQEVVVIDRQEAAFDKLPVDYSGYKIVGDAVELYTLREAGIEDVNYLFATTTQDTTNLMVAQVAKEIFGVPNVVARVFDLERESIYQDFGIKTISPTKLSANAFLKIVEE
jgi:trk system potassium uptake protein TrkA